MLRSMKVGDYMLKDMPTLDLETEIARATHMLLKTGQSGAPVMDRHGRLVGVFSLRDCLKIALQSFYHGEPGGIVKEYMSSEPVFVDPEQSILTLAEMFINGRFHLYPVVDNGRLVGVITRRDVVRALAEYHPA